MLNTSIYKAEFQDMLRNRSKDGNALKEGLDTISGGYLIPGYDADKFYQAMEKDCLFRKYATKITLDRTDGTIIAVASTGTAEITGEGQLYPVDADSITKIPYGSFKIASLCKLSQQFISDTKFDLDTYLMREFARRFARAEEKVLLTGTGQDEPLGLLNTADTVSTAGAGQITFDDVVTLYFSLAAEYRKDAVWIMNDETAFTLRMLKDQNGHPFWEHGQDRLFEKPVLISPYMPTIASGAKPILIGDLSYYWLLQRQELTIKPLFELFTGEGQVGYAAYERLDGKLVRQDAVRTLTVE
ncbi:MAG: phage major capsid protein [Bacillota bacterium]|jgi:HK97 family phage major capsid protein|nr:phage major capsid protein [Bacillota bacterium]